MLVQIGVRAPDQTDPLGQLFAGLRHAQSRLRALAHAGSSLAGLDGTGREEALAKLEEAVAFFEGPGEEAFLSEQELLVPQLAPRLQVGDPLCQELGTLGDEHRTVRGLQRSAARLGRRLLARPDDRQAGLTLQRLAATLLEIYGEHAERLEARVLPCARTMLGALELEAMGLKMAQRHGDPWGERASEEACQAPGLP